MTTAPEPAEAQSNDAPEELHPTLIGAMEDWLLSLRAALARAVDITALEARLAALNFAFILIIAVASGLLLATAWIALFAAIAAWCHELGLSWSAALLLVAGINLALAVTGGYAIYRMSNNLLFKTTRRFILHGDGDNGSAESADGNPPATP